MTVAVTGVACTEKQSPGEAAPGAGGGGSGGSAPVEGGIPGSICEAACKKEVAAGCPKSLDLSKCHADCDVGLSAYPGCKTLGDALVKCAAAAKGSFACRPTGEAELLGCDGEGNPYLYCVACAKACAKRATAGCSKEPDAAACEKACTAAGAKYAVCRGYGLALLGCAAQAGSFSCGADGKAALGGCDAEAQAHGDCVATQSCGPTSGDSPCVTCQKTTCCDKWTACTDTPSCNADLESAIACFKAVPDGGASSCWKPLSAKGETAAAVAACVDASCQAKCY